MVAAVPDLVASYKIKLDGTEIQDSQRERLEEIVVEQSVHLPDLCTLRFEDMGDEQQPTVAKFFDLIDGSTFTIGKELEVQLANETSPQSVFKGEITAVELEASEDGLPFLTVRAYSRGHRLHRGRKSRSFLKMSDADAAAKVIREAGLTASTTATTPVHDYLLQYNQTDWEFLKERAARNGYEVVVVDKTVHFRKPQNSSASGTAQKLWDNLLNFRVKMSSAHQADEVVVRGWDMKTKAAIVGQASSASMAPKIGESKTGKQAASTFGAAKVYVVNTPVATQDEANAIASAIYGELDGAYVEAEGTSWGDPSIKAGMLVEMKALGDKMSGKYYLTSVVHRYSVDRDYTTSFTVSGRRADTLHEYLQTKSVGTAAIQGLVPGLVTNVTDEDDLGRVKVKFPWMDGEQESTWARIATPMAGGSRGFFCLPEIDDEVLVGFEHGDPSRPYVVGFLWNKTDQPPKKNSEVVAQGKVNLRIFKTRAGHTITLDDTDGAEKITVVDKTDKNKIEIESASNTISITSEADVKITAKGKVEVDATGDATVKAKNATVTAQQNGSLTANQKLTLEGKQEVSIHGMKVSIKADTQAELQGGAQLTLKGGMVNIN